MGKGGAQLGKPVKGKSREAKKAAKEAKAEKSREKKSDVVAAKGVRMLADYERMNQMAEAQRLILKKLHQQETYNTKINKKLLTNIHRKFMRVDKVEALRKEIETLAQNHERDVDRKDAIIQMLTRDLDDAEEQFQTSQRSHMDKSNKLIEIHNQKCASLEQEFERDLKALKQEFSKESEEIRNAHNKEIKVMKAIISAVETEDNERIAEAKQAHETGREEIRNKNLEIINELRITLENKIEDLEKQFDEAHQNYVDGTGSANKEFKELQKDDKKLSGFIAAQKRKIEKYQTNLSYWKKKIETNKNECASRNSALLDQKKMILKHCNNLKVRMNKFRQAEAKKLTELSVLSRSSLRSIEDKLRMAERILQLAELARKFETEREKVLPFYESSTAEIEAKMKEGKAEGLSEAEEIRNLQMATSLDAQGNPVPMYDHLNNFYKKYNKVLVDKLAIDAEKTRLKKENNDLRNILKQYLDGIAITEDVVDHDNPLLIVNGRVNLLERDTAVKRMGRPNNVTELTQTVSNYRAQAQPQLR